MTMPKNDINPQMCDFSASFGMIRSAVANHSADGRFASPQMNRRQS
jgi:hypothetical protein